MSLSTGQKRLYQAEYYAEDALVQATWRGETQVDQSLSGAADTVWEGGCFADVFMA